MAVIRNRAKARQRRSMRIRSRVQGTADRPRLSVYKSNRYLYAQLINDDEGLTIASLSSSRYKQGSDTANCNQVDVCEKLGRAFGEAIVDHGVTRVVFDRSGYPYHGKIKAFADAVRQQGVSF